jgi:hypothetical protein
MLEREGEAFVACRQAVLTGARFWIDEEALPASILVPTYTRRYRRSQDREMATLGFADAVEALRSRGGEPVRIGAVDTDDPPYHFQLFMNGDATTVIACLGLEPGSSSGREVS